MKRISGPYSDQQWFIIRMNQLFDDVSEDGVCFGIAAMKMQAIFSGDSNLFDKRIKIMHEIPSEKFKEELERINKKRLKIIKTVKEETKPLRELNNSEKKELIDDEYLNIARHKLEETVDKLIKENKIPLNKKNEELSRREKICYFNAFIQNRINQKIDQLSEEDRIKLDIPIFLNGVQLYQQDSLYPYLYENGESPTIDRVLFNYPLASSKYFENKEGICKLRQFSSIYTVDELTHYFSLFTDISKSNITLNPLVFVLHNNDHAITIGYDPRKGEWSFTNASFLPSGYTCDPEELAKEVHKAFSNNDVAIFSTEIFTEKHAEKEWEETVSTCEKDEKLIETRTVTPEKTQRADSKNQALLSLAAAQGDLDLVNQVIEAEKVIPKEQRLRHVSCPALCMAVQNKNYNVVKRLLENGEDPNQTRQNDNVSPLLIAASQRDNSTISLLLENGSDPNAGTHDNFTSLHIAVLKDDPQMAKLILEKGGSCNNTAYNGITPLFLAAQNNKTEMVSLLLENNADIDLPMYSNSELLLSFAKNNNIYDQMEELIHKKLNTSEMKLPLKVLISLSNKKISKPYISITPREIATVLGNNDVLAILDNNLKQAFIS